MTQKNINHWYWECDPAWSTDDIAKATGCSSGTVWYYMKKYNIPRRDQSKANENRFSCPWKYKNFLKQRNSKEFRDSQSQNNIAAWNDPKIRHKFIEGIRKVSQKRLGEYQIIILMLLEKEKDLFLTEFVEMTHLFKKVLDNNLSRLAKRGIIAKNKEINENTSNPNKLHNKYRITSDGKDLLTSILTSNALDYQQILAKLQQRELNNIKARKACKKLKIGNLPQIGRNQLQILKIIKEQGPKFLRELGNDLELVGKNAIDKSLRPLTIRGILSRKKEYNPKGIYGNKKEFKYYLTERGTSILSTVL